MYAVIETGGKQYKVGVGDRLKVEKLSAEAGASVNMDRVLMVADGENIATGSAVDDSSVTATVIAHGKAGKIKVFKMKRRKNYRRTQGHRQDFTEIQITGIGDTQMPVKAVGEEAITEIRSEELAQGESPDPDSSIDETGAEQNGFEETEKAGTGES